MTEKVSYTAVVCVSCGWKLLFDGCTSPCACLNSSCPPVRAWGGHVPPLLIRTAIQGDSDCSEGNANSGGDVNPASTLPNYSRDMLQVSCLQPWSC